MREFLLAALFVMAAMAPWLVGAGPDKQLGTYSYWAWSAPDRLGEAVKVHLFDEEEGVVQWLILTPDGNRVTVTDTYKKNRGQTLTRLQDEESGWWAEFRSVMDPPDLADVSWGTYSDFAMSVSFLTSDGLHVERTFGPSDAEGDQRYEDWVAEALELEESPVSLPLSVIEEIRFLASLVSERHSSSLKHSAIDTIAEIASLVANASVAGAQIPEYDGHWNEGEVTGTSSPAVEALLSRFKSKRTKRSVSWAQDQIMNQ
ncbi:MAG: hypothetical protein AAF604_15025 [Acidobacteriota bacterium]